jgi:hypothetical protein
VNEPDDAADATRPQSDPHLSRLQMLSDVLLFQLKLVVDGLRDLLLSPISIGAALLGLLAGGTHPDRYFQRVLHFGRRTEKWINLFGEHDGPGTSDHLVDPLRARVIEEARGNPWLSKTGTRINKQLDGVNAALGSATQPVGDPAEAPPADQTSPRSTRAPD